MQATIITCDVCGRQKGETNHWYVAVYNPEEPAATIAFAPISGDLSTLDATVAIEHLCGQQCLHKRLDRWIASLNATNSPSEAA